MKSRSLFARTWLVALLPSIVLLDQATKILAVSQLTDNVRNGIQVSERARNIVGDWLWFFIAYNPGSAFSMTPQKFLPFISPTLFYSILTFVALGFLAAYLRRHGEPLLRAGALSIAAGALGNLLDRWRIDHVVDFISVGVPGIAWRWPTFNIADVAICTGVGILLFGEWVLEKRRTAWVDTPSGIGPRVEAFDPPARSALEATVPPEDRVKDNNAPGGAT